MALTVLRAVTNRMTSFRLASTLLVLTITVLWNKTGCRTAYSTDVVPATWWSPEFMMQIKRVTSVQVSPDGSRVIYSVRRTLLDDDQSEYRSHLFLANLDGTKSRQLTQGEKSCDDPQWSPDGQWIAFMSARGGRRNLWAIRPDGGEAHQLTDLKTDVSGFKWSPRGGVIAFTALDPITPDDERRMRSKNDAKVVDEQVKLNRLYAVDFVPLSDKPGPTRQLTKDTINVMVDSRSGRYGFDWSPDESQIVISHTTTPRADDWPTADLLLLNVADGSTKPLASTRAAESSPLFSPDGKSIAFTASDDPPTWAGARTVCILPAKGGTTTRLAETFDQFGRYSELVGWSKDGRQLFYTEAQGTSLKLLSLPLQGVPVEISRGAGLSSAGMSFTGVSLNSTRSHFGFSWEKLDTPVEAFVSPVSPFEPTRVSNVHGSLLLPPLGRTELVRWKSTEGMTVEGLLTYPAQFKSGERYPLLLVVHGGPMGVFTNLFDGSPSVYPTAAFAAKRYLVLRPNPRGSSGYGKAFRFANTQDWGGGDFRDVMSGVNHVISLGIVDADRMGIMGWSYGGFMTSWAITQTKRFRAASVGAGVTNLVSFTGTTDIPSFLPDYFGGEYWNNPEIYPLHSAMMRIKGVTTPTLIQHGERDERVPLSQGLELYNALKRQGCVTKLVIYPRSPHSIEEPRLLLDGMNRNLEWFDQYVGSAKK
ncbi:S9 family peptidase [Schlesneria paludicola]|uniref:S9 family peptidase n=1 Tax=Schlesneria paludicola TaxID=360056 RepID=UPI00029A5492|nr:S9 family peptidase [Schlesneria paludicola]